ncbi:MAG TPA: alanine--glyoxylate aminotransferase family protein [Planctomycetes bacterium]|nr:alanine--glyoxylate aminotransferase family protein [Planctomycetota bacterium]
MRKEYLLTPGPSQVPAEVLLRMAEPVFHHRTPRFMDMYKALVEKLRKVFMTAADVLVFASSGTGAMEASVVNLVPKGKKALAIESGKFGERWTEICRAFGVAHDVIQVEWGKAVNPDDVAAKLAADKDIVAVYATLVETSTGVEHPIKELGAAVAKTGAILVVDGISGAGASELRVDDWNVDVLVVGSQKALMLPPGLAVLTVGPKAKALLEQVKNPPAYYFDLKAALKAAGKADTPYTPALTLMLALDTAVSSLLEEGMENVFKRHDKYARAARAGMNALGLAVYPERPATALTAVLVPDGVDAEAVRKTAQKKYGAALAGGQDKLKGVLIRMAHMGYVGPMDIVIGLAALEMSLADHGVKAVPGAGVAAAEAVLREP